MTISSSVLTEAQSQLAMAREDEAVSKGELRIHTELADSLSKDGKVAKVGAENHAGALDVLRAYAQSQEEAVRSKVEAIVTDGLQAVFERADMEFAFKFELGRSGQMTATPIIRTRMGDEVVETKATDARGGGVLDIASFLLRCVFLVLLRPKLERVLVLDETFRHLSRQYLPNASTLLRRMSEKLKIQMIMVTHKDEFVEAADRVFDVSIAAGMTAIKQREG